MTDADGGIIYFNKRWLDFTGLTREAVFGAGWVQCLHPDDCWALRKSKAHYESGQGDEQ